jgi:LysM repeat protein
MSHHSGVAPQAQSSQHGVRRSTLLLILALILLLLAVAGFAIDVRGAFEKVPPTVEATPTATTASAGAAQPSTPTPTLTPMASPTPEELVAYVVQPGDTIASIAAQLEIPVTELLAANQLPIRPNLPNLVAAGQVLLVPDIMLTPGVEPPATGDDATATPTSTATATATPSPPPTATATASPTATALPTPTPSGRFTMGFPLTMTIGSRQIVYIQIVDAARVAASTDDFLAGTDAAGKIKVALVQPDVRTEIVHRVDLYAEMLAELDAPAFDVDAPGAGDPEAPAWRSLRNGSAVWTWNLTAREAGVQLITMRVSGRDSPTATEADVHFEAPRVVVLGASGLDAFLNSPLVRTASSPAILLLSALVGAGGFAMRRKERLDRPVEGLPGTQVKQLHTALLSAFPTDESLAQMVRIQLDQNLEVISTGRNLGNITYDLIRWAEANGQVERLIAGARAENPGNPELQQLAIRK